MAPLCKEKKKRKKERKKKKKKKKRIFLILLENLFFSMLRILPHRLFNPGQKKEQEIVFQYCQSHHVGKNKNKTRARSNPQPPLHCGNGRIGVVRFSDVSRSTRTARISRLRR